jgi:SAM-dependent methyltransferase
MKLFAANLLNSLRCPACTKGGFSQNDEELACGSCSARYPILNSKLCFTKTADEDIKQYEAEAGRFVNRLKKLVKEWPAFFVFLTYAIGSVSFFGRKPKKTIETLFGERAKEKLIVNVGSGITKVHPHVINLDIFPFKNVDVVADAASLPFKDNSLDMLISESTLEHTLHAEEAIREIRRVIKPGGFVYISIPFVMPFHASPNDYLRLTHEGLKQRFHDFTPKKIGALGGPASALVTFLMYFFALPFSLISEAAYNLATYFFMAILSPLRIFDLLFNLFPRHLEVSTLIYFIGEKNAGRK